MKCYGCGLINPEGALFCEKCDCTYLDISNVGFMEGIDRCCVVETSIDKVFMNLNEYYESYERIDKANIEKYVGAETTQKVDNLYGHYLEYSYKDCSVRILCNADGSTSYEVGMYVTQNELAFLEFIEKEFPIQ